MKNKFKFFVIVAIVALTGMMLFSSCSDAEFNQTVIKVTGLSAYDGDDGYIHLTDGTRDWYGFGAIGGGVLLAPMYNISAQAVELSGPVNVELAIEDSLEDPVYYGEYDYVLNVTGGENTLSYSNFTGIIF